MKKNKKVEGFQIKLKGYAVVLIIKKKVNIRQVII